MNAKNATVPAAAEIASADEIEATIASTKFIDIHGHCTEFELPPVYLKGKRPLCVPEDLLAHYDRLGVEKGVILALCNPDPESLLPRFRRKALLQRVPNPVPRC